MDWKGMYAWVKCKNSFGGDPSKITEAIKGRDASANANSCAATQVVLGTVISPGKENRAIQSGKDGNYVPIDVAEKISALLDKGNVIYLEVKPNHHFTVIPLSDKEVSILQGFQSAYNLAEWINATDGGVMRKSSFLPHLATLLSSNKDNAKTSAKALFAFPGVEGPIEAWVDTAWSRYGAVKIAAIGYTEV